MMLLCRECPPLRTTNARTKVFNLEIRYRKATTQQSVPTMCTIGQTLRGLTMKQVWWGRNKKPIWKWCQLGKKCFSIWLFRSSSAYAKIKKILGPEIQKLAHFSLVSLSPRTRSRPGAERIRQGEGRLSRPPRTALERSYLTENSSSENRILKPRRKAPERIPPKKDDHIYIFSWRAPSTSEGWLWRQQVWGYLHFPREVAWPPAMCTLQWGVIW